MRKRQLKLSLLDKIFGICVFANNIPIPEWAATASLCSITRTKKGLTVVCPQSIIPSDCEYDPNWRCFRIDGNFDLNQIGVISSLSSPLAQADISIFVISTYDTDYILVKEEKVERAIAVLTDYGNVITRLGNTVGS